MRARNAETARPQQSKVLFSSFLLEGFLVCGDFEGNRPPSHLHSFHFARHFLTTGATHVSFVIVWPLRRVWPALFCSMLSALYLRLAGNGTSSARESQACLDPLSSFPFTVVPVPASPFSTRHLDNPVERFTLPQEGHTVHLSPVSCARYRQLLSPS